jgi:uncharacterized membrane protein YhaH (DUF805 family)
MLRERDHNASMGNAIVKKKNPFLASLLGGLFGPIGAFYFGRKTGLSLLLVFVASFVYRVIFPAWYPSMRWEFLVFMVCYGILFPVATVIFNSTQESANREQFSAMFLGNCFIAINVGVRGIADAVQSNSSGKTWHVLLLFPRVGWELLIGYGIVMGSMMLTFRDQKKSASSSNL